MTGKPQTGFVFSLNDISMVLADDCCSKRNMLVSAAYRQAPRQVWWALGSVTKEPWLGRCPVFVLAGGNVLVSAGVGADSERSSQLPRHPPADMDAFGQRRSFLLQGGGLALFSQLPVQGVYTEPQESPRTKARAVTDAGPSPLIPHSLDHPTPKWLSQSHTSHFEVLLWGDTLPTAQGQGSPYDQEKNPKRILPIIAKWQNFPPSGFRKFKGMKKVNLDSSNHFS